MTSLQEHANTFCTVAARATIITSSRSLTVSVNVYKKVRVTFLSDFLWSQKSLDRNTSNLCYHWVRLPGPAFKSATVTPPVTKQTEKGDNNFLKHHDQKFCASVFNHIFHTFFSQLPLNNQRVKSPSPNLSQWWEDIQDQSLVRDNMKLLCCVFCVVFCCNFISVLLSAGAILPLALGIIITALLLLMIGCRLRLVRHKLKKARPLTTEESDYLINGMYL